MSVYAIALINISDRSEYAVYEQGFVEIFRTRRSEPDGGARLDTLGCRCWGEIVRTIPLHR